MKKMKKPFAFILASALMVSAMTTNINAKAAEPGNLTEVATETDTDTQLEEAEIYVNDIPTDNVAINQSNFPDANFRQYIAGNIDKDGNGVLSKKEIEDTQTIEVDFMGINQLNGIEIFQNLKALTCNYNNLSTLDVSKNVNLEELQCGENNLSTLDVSKNVKLIYFWCDENNLSSLDVSKNTKLTHLICAGNHLSTLDVSQNASLIYLWCSENNLSTLDVSKNAKLEYLYCYENNLTTLDLSNNLNLEDLQCDDGVNIIYATSTPNVSVSYRTHVQTYGWQNAVTNGTMSGTSGKAKRLEGINISVSGNDNLGIQYTTHCQSYGWLPWSSNGEMSGTEGEAKRLEAIKIQLTGKDKYKYDVYYRVHAQSYGWLGWTKNGEPAGTAGYAKRLEAIQVIVVKKGEGINTKLGNITSARNEAYIATEGTSPVVGNEATDAQYPYISGNDTPNVSYRTHVQTYGWQGWKYNGQMSGTSGQAKRLEGINIKLTNKQYSGGIAYTTHVQTYGWQGNVNDPSTWKKDGQMAGTSGQAKRLEAICIKLTGDMEQHYDIYYRVHAQTYGWLGWSKNGAPAGTAGLAKRLEGIQIVLVPKGGAAPANNYGGVKANRAESYIAK